MLLSGHLDTDATMAAPTWIPHSAPLGLPLAPLLAEPLQPLVLGVLLAAGVGLMVLLPRFALMVFAGHLGAAALRGSLSPVSLALRLVHLLRSPANAAHLQRSLEQAERGELLAHTLLDADQCLTPIRSMPAAERLAWTAAAWEDDLYWQGQDRRQMKRINQLIQACRTHDR